MSAKPQIGELMALLDLLGLPFELLPPPAEGILPGWRLVCGCGLELAGETGDDWHFTVCDGCDVSPILLELAEAQATENGVELEQRFEVKA